MLSRGRSPSRGLRISLIAALVPVLAAGAALVTKKTAHAEDAEADKKEHTERCAVRLSMALLGQSPDAALLASKDPQASVDAMIARKEFQERFAGFINAESSGIPTENAANDPVYALAHYVIKNNKPWSEVFNGQYGLNATANGIDVAADPDGAGYFRSDIWRKKFQGMDEEGTMIVAGFRIVQNTTGLELKASVGNAGEDRGANARKADACKGCHYDAWYALDKVALLLPKREGKDAAAKFTDRAPSSQQLLGKTLKSDKELINELVNSEAFKFNQCRRVYKFLYGRQENQCEAKVFDACVDALTETKTIQSAVAVVAKDPSFCAN